MAQSQKAPAVKRKKKPIITEQSEDGNIIVQGDLIIIKDSSKLQPESLTGEPTRRDKNGNVVKRTGIRWLLGL